MGGRGSGGGNRLSDATKRARGTWRRDRAQQPGPRHWGAGAELAACYVRGTPEMPGWLPEPAKAVWRQVVPALAARGVLCKLDRYILTVYCLTAARVLANPRPKPCDIAQFRALSRELGLTRATWHRVPVLPLPPGEEDSP